jgi:hypothetical protein
MYNLIVAFGSKYYLFFEQPTEPYHFYEVFSIIYNLFAIKQANNVIAFLLQLTDAKISN